MNSLRALAPSLSLAAFLTAASAAPPEQVFKDAVAVWSMSGLDSSDGRAPLKAVGEVAIGIPLEGAERSESLARGGDGMVARFSGSRLSAGQGNDHQLQISGEELTLLLRFRLDDPVLPDSEFLAKYGGLAKTSYNIYANRGKVGFQIGLEDRPDGRWQVDVPGSMLGEGWHDLVARYDGVELTLFLDGVVVARRPASGNLRLNEAPLEIGKALRGLLDHAAIWKRALSDDEIVTLSGGGEVAARQIEVNRPKIEAITGKDQLTTVDQLRAARDLRAKLAADPHRPRYHLMPPDGYWNDINGTLFWKGRYHVFFLGRQAPDTETVLNARDVAKARETWLHASSADLVHWVQHPVALTPTFDSSMPRGLYSGDAVDGAPVPTLIYHVPEQGTHIATAANPEDPELIDWKPHPANPVITAHGQPREVNVFDPTAWREADGTYYALVGNKNSTPGHEGDSTSLYRSKDLLQWEYRGPFYKSDRKWTEEVRDAACPDFFPIGHGKHMLVMHMHLPFFGVHYYIGVWDRANERFIPEQHGMMNWPGGSLCAPETLLDGKGRRVFWGWVREEFRSSDAWGSVASLPRILSLAQDGSLLIAPAPELETLRYNERTFEDISVSGERVLEGVRGDLLEIRAEILPGHAKEFGLIVRQSPGGEEQLPIVISLPDGTFSTDLTRASLNEKVRYPRFRQSSDLMKKAPESERYVTSQVAPFSLAPGETVDLRVFIDKSIVEVFVNGRQCLTQRIYPTRSDAQGISLIAKGGEATFKKVQVWDMHPTQ